MERLPSLDLLVELLQSERDKQLAHFDALDNRAGVALAFSGLLITLAPDVPVILRILGVVSAAASAVLSLWAFWPRRFPVMNPGRLRSYLRAEDGFTRLTVLDTLAAFIDEGTALLRTKLRRLRWALRALTATSTLFALGIVVRAIRG